MSRSGRRKEQPGSSSGKDYEVGYRRPPVASRFKVGNPGNPTGRRKKRKTVGQTIDGAMTKPIRVEENGRSRTVTAQDLIILNLVRSAARGDPRAIRLLFDLQERYRDSAETTLNPADLETEDRKIIEQYLDALQRQQSESSNTNGENPGAFEGDKRDQNPDAPEDETP